MSDLTGLDFKVSTRCETSACAAVARTSHAAFLRDTKAADGPILTFDRAAWTGFLAGVRAGQFDLD